MKTRFTLKVSAGARRTQFAGKHGEAWKLQVAAPPVDGKANDAIVSFLAKLAGVRTSQVQIVSGHTGPMKIIEIAGIDAAQIERVILESNGLNPDTGSAAARKA
jgi:uncharacterized protein (TIGR00251 family)